MAGSSSIQGDQVVTFTDNMSFDGTDRGGAMNANGQLFIGSATSNRPNNGGHVRLGALASADGSVTITNGPGTIDLAVATQQFSPNAVLELSDDFLGASPALPWYGYGGNFLPSASATTDHPGIIQSDPPFAGNNTVLTNRYNNGAFLDGQISTGGGELKISWTVRIPALSAGANTYVYSIGMMDGISTNSGLSSYVNGIFFQYSDTLNAGQWTLNATSASVTTTTNTSTAVTTDWITLSITVNAAATSVSYYINNVLVGTINTNVPTALMVPSFIATNTAGTNPTGFQADLFWLRLVLSNPRPGPSPSTGSTSGVFIGNYVNTAVSYQVLGTDAIIGVTDTSAPRTITMPAIPGSIAQIWTIKDESLAASVNNITIDGNGNNIDGAPTFPINTNGGSVDIYWSGTAFFIK